MAPADMTTSNSVNEPIQELVEKFRLDLQPLEQGDAVLVLVDNRTGAHYSECHVRGSKLVERGTTDVPLDPDHPSYRANRKITDDEAFEDMQKDAVTRRSFSNIVTEYVPSDGDPKPLKVIGGQHRFAAINGALEAGVDEYHGLKVYFGLDMSQRLDVQLISNTNIEVSGALTDRLKETFRGPSLREWCQAVGFLKPNEDFGDTKIRGGAITVDLVRTFIHNFYLGKSVVMSKFSSIDTTPILYKSGQGDKVWEDFLSNHSNVWKDKKLLDAGKQFVRLVNAQRSAFAGQSGVADFSEKALNGAVLSAWAFAAGMFQSHSTRLKRHYAIADTKSKDPLNAKALAAGRHKTDKDNYRGLGYRTDPRERAQMVELFNLLSEGGDSVTAKFVQSAIYARFAKQAALDAKKIKGS
jgi:hypothetical protein